jgi:hypothetical protein
MASFAVTGEFVLELCLGIGVDVLDNDDDLPVLGFRDGVPDGQVI